MSSLLSFYTETVRAPGTVIVASGFSITELQFSITHQSINQHSLLFTRRLCEMHP
jgi:hypothetical protein